MCPLCRTPFEAQDVRRLHIDRSPQLTNRPLASLAPTEVADDTDSMARHYQDAITRIVRLGDTMGTHFHVNWRF
jgi:hypothetical protein